MHLLFQHVRIPRQVRRLGGVSLFLLFGSVYTHKPTIGKLTQITNLFQLLKLSFKNYLVNSKREKKVKIENLVLHELLSMPSLFLT